MRCKSETSGLWGGACVRRACARADAASAGARAKAEAGGVGIRAGWLGLRLKQRSSRKDTRQDTPGETAHLTAYGWLAGFAWLVGSQRAGDSKQQPPGLQDYCRITAGLQDRRTVVVSGWVRRLLDFADAEGRPSSGLARLPGGVLPRIVSVNHARTLHALHVCRAPQPTALSPVAALPSPASPPHALDSSGPQPVAAGYARTPRWLVRCTRWPYGGACFFVGIKSALPCSGPR